MKQSGIEVKDNKVSAYTIFIQLVALLLVTFIFMLSLELLGASFHLLGEDILEQIILATSNPFIGLFIGLLTTAIIQSSSTITSMVVAVVASGALSLESAVPMIMGANIGTTITCTIVSLGYIADKKEFRKAFAVAMLHNLFNILSTLIIFPLEYYFGLLSDLSQTVTKLMIGSGYVPGGFLKLTLSPVAEYITSFSNHNGILLLIASVILLFSSIKYLNSLFKKIIIGESQKKIDKYVFGGPGKSFVWGVGLTGAIHSSSITTSLIVTLVAVNKLSIRKAFPFIIGANIGTTITALIAAISKSEAALSIALAHVLFNVIGAVIFYPVPFIRNIPLQLARFLGSLTMKNRLISLAYIIFTFFLIPFLLIYFVEPKPSKVRVPIPVQTPVEENK